MEIRGVNPFVRYCGVSRKPTLSKTFVLAYDCRLFYINDTYGKVYTGNECFEYSPDCIILIREAVPYRFEADSEKCENILKVNFDLDMAHCENTVSISPCREDKFRNELVFKNPDNSFFSSHIFLKNCRRYRDFLYELSDLAATNDEMRIEKSSAALKYVLTDIFCSYRTQKNGFPTLVSQMLSYVHREFASEIDSDVLSEKFGYHPYYLSRLFKQHTGTTFHRYLLKVRMDEAKKLLIKTNKSIDEISFAVGFGNGSYFAYAFKEHCGTTPGKFRRQFTGKML